MAKYSYKHVKLLLLVMGWILAINKAYSQQVTATKTIKLEFITKVPAVIDGCAGLYTYDTTSLKKRRFIIATNMQELAFVKIGGRLIKLDKVDERQAPGSQDIMTYKGEGISVKLTVKSVHEGYESSIDIGTLQIDQGTLHLIVKIHGESGC
jgi:hypothetical protein